MADRRLAGLEFFNASAILPPAWLTAAEHVDSEERVFERMVERVGRAIRAPRVPETMAERTH